MMNPFRIGYGPGYLDPTLVYNLVIDDRTYDLVRYMKSESIPGESEDPHCLQIRLIAHTVLMRRISGELDDALHRDLAESARRYATESRLFALQMGGGPSNLPPDAGYNMHPHNSSSYSGRMLTNEPGSNELGHAAMYNQSSASNPRNHTATFHPLQANSTDGHNMHPHNSSSYSGMLIAEPGSNDAAKLAVVMHNNQLSASYSRNHTATFPRLQLNSNEAYVPSRDNYTLGHNMHPHNSSSYSGRMLTKEPCSNEVTDSEMHNQSSGSNSRNHTVTFPPAQANSNDAQAFSPQKHGP